MLYAVSAVDNTVFPPPLSKNGLALIEVEMQYELAFPYPSVADAKI
jgi:hypothetical protein